MKRIMLLICCLCYINTLHAVQRATSADDISRNIEVIQGSEALSIRSIDQDEKGMIWFGTDKNLFSYDGYQFVRHHDINGNNDHFQINTLICFDEKVLLGCIDGVVIYDTIEETFEQIEFLIGNETHDMEYDQENGIIWIGTDIGLFKLEIESGNISAAVINSEHKPTNIWSLKIHGNVLYIGMRRGFGKYCLDGSNSYEKISDNVFKRYYSTIGSIEVIDDQHLLIGASKFLAVYNTATQESQLISEFSWVKNIGRIDNLFLIGTDAGLFSYDRITSRIENIKKTVVWGILNDKNGNLWFGTDNGLMVSMGNRLITKIKGIPTDANHLFSSISGNNDGLYFAGGSYGMVVINAYNEDSPIRWYKMEDIKYPFRHNKVRQIIYDKNKDDIWVSTAGGALKYNKEKESFDLYYVSNNSFYQAYDILFDDDKMWFASLDGLLCVQNDSIVKMYTRKNGLTSSKINQISRDKNKNIWMRTFDRNIYYLKKSSEKIIQFNLPGSKNFTRGDQLYSDSSGNIWIASSNNIYKINIDESENNIIEYKLKGNHTKECLSIIEVNNTIWACYPNSIYILDKSSTDIQHIWTRSNYSDMYFDNNNQMVLLGSLDKIDAIRINDLKRHFETSTAPVHITSVIVNDSYAISQKELSSGKITLPYKLNNISISFSNFGFNQENTPRFKYRIGESGNQWTETEGRGNHILLSDLAPKKYDLYITSFGGNNPEKATLTITIKRPWFLSNTAIILYICATILLMYIITSSMIFRKQVKVERIQKAYEMSQAKSKINFFADISHELKTPLSLIIAPISKLLHEIKDPEHKRTIQLIHDNAIKLNSLIHITLGYYKESNDFGKSIISSSIEVVGFIKRIFQTYKDSTPDLYFIFKSNYEEIHASLDVIKTETIISNILSNSCKYTSKEGSIILMIDYDSETNYLLIKISDTGIGIPKEELPFIFQRYYQSSRTVKSFTEGTGLGLSIVKNYVEMLGGVISVSSNENGTTTIINIPIQPEIENNISKIKTNNTNDNKPLIAIIDDNKSVCEFLESTLNDKYRCISAFNGKNGLKLCQDMIPDLIISDVVMPVMDGLEMCKKIRETATLSMIPIILLTAKDDKETEKNSIDLNIESFIGKPFDLDTLLAKVNQLVGQKERVEAQVRLRMITEPKESHTLSNDEKFLISITKIIEDNLDDSELSVSKLCDKSKYNEKQLYRKIKGLTGMSTIEYIKSIRLKKAAQLLQNGSFTVSEVMYIVGFSNSSYFARAFSSQFGKTPKEYMKSFKDM